MKNTRFSFLPVLVILLITCTSTAKIRACDVSTYIAILKSEQDNLKKIPKKRTSRELVVGYTEGTKYMVKKLTKLFEQRMKGFTVFTEELTNLRADCLTEGSLYNPEKNKSDLIIVPTLLNKNNNLLHKVSDWAITFASDELVLVFGGAGKHKETIKKLSWTKVTGNKNYTMVIATDPKKCLSHHTKALCHEINREWPITKTQIATVETGIEVIEKIVKGEADYGFIYKSMARTYSMITKDLPANINQHDSISYGFTIKKRSPNNASAALFAETMLSTGGYFRIQVSGLTAISGGKIDFKTR